MQALFQCLPFPVGMFLNTHPFFVLGPSGVYTTEKGLKIAYISGIEGSTLNLQNAKNLCSLCKCYDLYYTGVDVLLTSPWPENVTSGDPASSYQPKKPSKLLSWLVTQLKPRYHVCAYEGIAYERPPFVQYYNGKTGVTRFIALGDVGNKDKHRWLYELTLKPMLHTGSWERFPNETPSPFQIKEIDKDGNVEFYDDKNRISQPKNPRNKRYSKKCCHYCLNNVERDLIVHTQNLSYLAFAKDGIKYDHLIISSIGHHGSVRDSPRGLIREIEKFKKVLRALYEKQDKIVVFYDKNFKSSHFRMHAVAIGKEFSEPVKQCVQVCAIFKYLINSIYRFIYPKIFLF